MPYEICKKCGQYHYSHAPCPITEDSEDDTPSTIDFVIPDFGSDSPSDISSPDIDTNQSNDFGGGGGFDGGGGGDSF